VGQALTLLPGLVTLRTSRFLQSRHL